jgi:hypothetical protein
MKPLAITIYNENHTRIFYERKKTDPECLRVSIGGRAEVGYYCVFRGDNLNEIETMLKDVLKSFKSAKAGLNEDS